MIRSAGTAELPAGAELFGLSKGGIAVARALADGARRARQDAQALERAAMVAEHSG